MLVDTQELPDSKAESPATPSRHSPLRVRADLHEEYSPDEIAKMTELYEPVQGTLVKKIKGGVVVDLMGVDAFLPGSQIALRRVPNIDELLGQTFEFKIIKLNKRRRNIVVSRRVLLEAERKTKREVL